MLTLLLARVNKIMLHELTVAFWIKQVQKPRTKRSQVHYHIFQLFYINVFVFLQFFFFLGGGGEE